MFTPTFMIKDLIRNNKKTIIRMLEVQIKKKKEKEDYHYLGKKINVVIINIIKKSYLENDTL